MGSSEKFKKPITLFLLTSLLVMCFAFSGTAEVYAEEVAVEIPVLKDEEFGALYLGVTIKEFNEMGFTFGDSIDVILSNGFEMTDIPYFDGYYVPVGAPLACGYPGYPHVAVAYNFGDSVWALSGADNQTTAKVILREKGKYLATEELYQLAYSDVQQESEPDECFANFREVTGGNMKKHLLYRSASPCDNTHNRAECTDILMKKAGIRCVLNLADSLEELNVYREQEDYNSDYYDSLEAEGNVLLLNLGANYMDERFCNVVSERLYDMIQHEGPYLIHCLEGKDRPGFICALLLCLVGASLQEIIDDYMVTFKNYYGIVKEENPERYEAVTVLIYSFLSYITGTDAVQELTPEVLKKGAENYLSDGGLSEDQITEIEEAFRQE